MVDPDFIPSTPLDLVVLRDKFVEAVRRHLLAEVTLGINSFVLISLRVERGGGRAYRDSFSYGKYYLSVSKRSSHEIFQFFLYIFDLKF
jgi:hypothetical protein